MIRINAFIRLKDAAEADAHTESGQKKSIHIAPRMK